MNFGHVIESLRLNEGKAFKRLGWNGKGMFVFYVPPTESIPKVESMKKHFGENTLVLHKGYLAIKNVDETVSTWVPSINDVFC